MAARDTDCRFCNVATPLLADDLAFVVFDRYPVTPGHALIVPRRHIEDVADATPEEFVAMLSLLRQMRRRIDSELAPDGAACGRPSDGAAPQSDHGAKHAMMAHLRPARCRL